MRKQYITPSLELTILSAQATVLTGSILSATLDEQEILPSADPFSGEFAAPQLDFPGLQLPGVNLTND